MSSDTPAARHHVAGMDLVRASDVDSIVEALGAYGITQEELKRALGEPRTNGTTSSQLFERLDAVREVVLLLSDSLSPRGVGEWWHARNRLLDGERPIDVLGEDPVERIAEAAGAFVDGAYI